MFERKEEQDTIVGASVKLKGNLKSEGKITISGSLMGEVKTKGDVLITKEATVEGKVKGQKITLSGTVNGNLEGQEQVEITETGKIFGDLKTNILVIKAGGIFTGRSEMKPETLKEEAPEVSPEPEYVSSEEK